jgi:hypothetical protein
VLICIVLVFCEMLWTLSRARAKFSKNAVIPITVARYKLKLSLCFQTRPRAVGFENGLKSFSGLYAS